MELAVSHSPVSETAQPVPWGCGVHGSLLPQCPQVTGRDGLGGAGAGSGEGAGVEREGA